MNNYIELLTYNKNQVGGSESKKFNGGFPNLILNKKNSTKVQYKYNIENNINKDIINIKNILEKRKEEKSIPLIDYEISDTKNIIKKQEHMITNIDINEFK
jgi:hypothetical protein